MRTVPSATHWTFDVCHSQSRHLSSNWHFREGGWSSCVSSFERRSLYHSTSQPQRATQSLLQIQEVLNLYLLATVPLPGTLPASVTFTIAPQTDVMPNYDPVHLILST